MLQFFARIAELNPSMRYWIVTKLTVEATGTPAYFDFEQAAGNLNMAYSAYSAIGNYDWNYFSDCDSLSNQGCKLLLWSPKEYSCCSNCVKILEGRTFLHRRTSTSREEGSEQMPQLLIS